jgi:hypothetical protein
MTDIENLKKTWTILFPNLPAPDDRQWVRWSLTNDEQTLRQALAALTSKFEQLSGQMTPEFMIRHMSATANRLTRQEYGC